MGYYSSRANQRSFADGDATHNYRSAPDGGAALHSRGHHLPVGLRLETAILACPWVKIVNEHDAVAHEYIVFDGDPFANKSVRRDLAPAPDGCIFLDLDKGSYLGVVAHSTTVEIHQIGMEDFDFAAQDYVGRNWHEDRCVRFVLEGEVPYLRAFSPFSKWNKSHDTTELCRYQLPLLMPLLMPVAVDAAAVDAVLTSLSALIWLVRD
jgi:hypothetical protein